MQLVSPIQNILKLNRYESSKGHNSINRKFLTKLLLFKYNITPKTIIFKLLEYMLLSKIIIYENDSIFN